MNIFDRKFKLWFYQISHSEAIIRSPKVDLDKVYDSNIDIYLGDISYIEMPYLFNGLQIGEASNEECSYLSQRVGKDIFVENIVVLISEGKRYYIVASIIKIMENNLDFGELPIYTFLLNKED